ncbi:MAG: GNAT family N-acetyltransferase [Oligoflexales bacterium]
MDLVIESLYRLRIDEFIDVHNKAFANYLVPVPALNELQMSRVFSSQRVDQGKSLVAFEDGKPIGFANVAVRGWSLRIASVGVIPEYRRQGVARRLLEKIISDAKNQNYRTIELEVFPLNERAVKLYASLGFEVVRKIYAFKALPTISKVSADQGITEIDPFEAGKIIDSYDDLSLPWVCSGWTLSSWGPRMQAFVSEHAVAWVCIVDETRAILFCLAVRPSFRNQGHGTKMVEYLFSNFSTQAWEITRYAPEESKRFFEKCGFIAEEPHQQQMRLKLR